MKAITILILLTLSLQFAYAKKVKRNLSSTETNVRICGKVISYEAVSILQPSSGKRLNGVDVLLSITSSDLSDYKVETEAKLPNFLQDFELPIVIEAKNEGKELCYQDIQIDDGGLAGNNRLFIKY